MTWWTPTVWKEFSVFCAPHTEEPTNWSRRYKANWRSFTCNVLKVAEVVRDLWRRERERGLAGEKRMLAKARQILVSELARGARRGGQGRSLARRGPRFLTSQAHPPRTGIGIDVHRLAPGRPMNVACLLFDDELVPMVTPMVTLSPAHVMRCWAPLVSAISAVTTGQPIRSGPMPQVQPSSPKPRRGYERPALRSRTLQSS